jgi:hypothetical protein
MSSYSFSNNIKQLNSKVHFFFSLNSHLILSYISFYSLHSGRRVGTQLSLYAFNFRNFCYLFHSNLLLKSPTHTSKYWKHLNLLFFIFFVFKKLFLSNVFNFFQYLEYFLAAEVLKMLYNTVHIPCIKQIQKYINNQKMHFNIYDIFYSQYSHQHISARIPVIFRVMFLLQEYSCG